MCSTINQTLTSIVDHYISCDCPVVIVYISYSYAVQEKLQAFYTGGVVRFSSDGRHMFCMCGSAVNVVELSSLAVKQTMEEVKTRERERDVLVSLYV